MVAFGCIGKGQEGGGVREKRIGAVKDGFLCTTHDVGKEGILVGRLKWSPSVGWCVLRTVVARVCLVVRASFLCCYRLNTPEKVEVGYRYFKAE